ncbi:MAG: NAD(P)H-binding protein [Hamadaea sp.]|nr:NAD(P)H-binding protein [Hamadaea sp.]
MTTKKIIVFGAGGNAGREIVGEALRRGHTVTAVVRDRAAHPDLPANATAATGDATDAASVAVLAAGHDVVVGAVYRADADAGEFFAAAGQALANGALTAGGPRLLWVGVASTLPDGSGVRMCDAPEFPAQWRDFALAHDRASAVFRASPDALDWVIVTPPMRLEQGERSGAYRSGSAILPGTDRITYADLAVAVVDEAESAAHHREQIAVAHP